MLYNMGHVVMLYYITWVMLCYITCPMLWVMLYNITGHMLCYITCVMLCYRNVI